MGAAAPLVNRLDAMDRGDRNFSEATIVSIVSDTSGDQEAEGDGNGITTPGENAPAADPSVASESCCPQSEANGEATSETSATVNNKLAAQLRSLETKHQQLLRFDRALATQA